MICLEGGGAAVAGLASALARLLVETRGASVGEGLLWRADWDGARLMILGEAELVPALLEDGRVTPWTGRMRIGVSGSAGITDLPRAAQQALSVCAGARRLGQAARWEASGPPSVMDLLDEDKARAFARARLGAVVEQPEMLELLRIYLSEAGAVQRIADRLGVHRNSVSARLVRLRRALGVDIEDAEQRANLWIASHYLRK
ncbi:helix-turn-helix domain-containing protein [Actinomyces timonensis]|uniref:Helix-turn-helix domain-containing protein n=1 Tax=Actinomyces timonensis TaxID=1288391 RepID=A0AAU8N177_9ACTO